MEKAFEVNNLVERLKAQGLPMAEEAVQKAVKEVFAWAGESCAMKGGLFLVGATILPILAEQLDKLADKIDGVEGQ